MTLVRATVSHFLGIAGTPDGEEAQRLRLMVSSHLKDGEFARLLYDKIGQLVSPLFAASLDHAVAAGDAVRVRSAPLDLFWFALHTIHMVTLTGLPPEPALAYGAGRGARLELELTEFILRGVGLNAAAITYHLADTTPSQPLRAEESA